MVTIADSVTRDELSNLVEATPGQASQASLEEFIESLDFSWDEKEVIIASIAALPAPDTSPKAMPKNAPDMFRMNWWS